MLIYNLLGYGDNYSKTSGSLWQYYRDEPFLNDIGAIADFLAENNDIASFKFKTNIAGRIEKNGTLKLKYLSNFLRTLETLLIKFEINLTLTLCLNCFIRDAPIDNQMSSFTITDTNLYVPVVTLSTQGNVKLPQQS